jgi:hypothetical protein
MRPGSFMENGATLARYGTWSLARALRPGIRVAREEAGGSVELK